MRLTQPPHTNYEYTCVKGTLMYVYEGGIGVYSIMVFKNRI